MFGQDMKLSSYSIIILLNFIYVYMDIIAPNEKIIKGAFSRTHAVLRFLVHQKKEEGDFPFGIEDLLYYVKRIEGQQFNLDLGALKQYFPFNLVMSGILKICQDLFGLRFEEIADAEVFGTVMFTFIQSMTYLLVNFWAISALICSPDSCGITYFSASKGVGHTGLLRFSEVVNLFHEFGHVIPVALFTSQLQKELVILGC
ncbi:hypothetical protein TEA_012980 [Camellia sinensis var. sinensis]|uniref:Peptidase M3A/M3B catalytic domain-containing protein n=1 Tax=Camellia sinensis var. sinensis TaxID=542762 RepID=A0A4S4F3C5_CAMSN|nr:hypothetical protein TEA_012980 [Camellia sinensis var. sinensis]